MTDFALLFVRLTVGTLLAGHGVQKLFGWFKGPGLKGTHGFMEMLGMQPGKVWGTAAAVGETSGGVLTMLGFLNPLGPLNIMAAMLVAVRRAHWKFPVWVSEGGAELAATNLAIAGTLAVIGPGRFSLDRLFGIRIPRWLNALLWVQTIAVVGAALTRPQLAQTVLDKATSLTGKSTSPTAQDVTSQDTTLEVETRPAPVTDPVSTTV